MSSLDQHRRTEEPGLRWISQVAISQEGIRKG